MDNHHIEKLCKSHNRQPFFCGEETLDKYLKEAARQDMKRFLAVTYVMLDEQSKQLLGYYTLSMTQLDSEDIPVEHRRQLPRYAHLPATLIGRIAVDLQHHGKGLGIALLLDACKFVHHNSQHIGSFAVVVDSISQRATEFYLKFGFIRTLTNPRKLFLPMSILGKHILNLLPQTTHQTAC